MLEILKGVKPSTRHWRLGGGLLKLFKNTFEIN